MKNRWIARMLALVLLILALVPAAGLAEAEAKAKAPTVNLKLGVKETYQIDAASVSGAAGKVLKYASKNKKIASVDGTGKITAKKKGKTQIAVGYDKTVLAIWNVTVLAAPKSVSVSPKTVVMSVGENGQLKATLPKNTASALSYSSDNAAVATVDTDGKVTAVASGEAVVTVRTFNKHTSKCTVKVLAGKAPTQLSLNASALNLQVKESFKLVPAVDEGSDALYKFSSANKKIAKVSSAGVVTGVKKGTTTITVKTHNGLSKKVKVNVRAALKLTEVYDYLTNSAETYAANVAKLKLKKDTTGTDPNTVMYYNGQLALIYGANGCQIDLNTAVNPKYSLLGVNVSMTPEQAAAKLQEQGWTMVEKKTVDGVEQLSFAKAGDATRSIRISSDDGAQIRGILAQLKW